ncbi:MAG TPA: hypothetical protein VFI31_06215 [Pirellulales bacterium]|nr:hypothetical protein [Pirellulales bacterium]
MNLPGKVGLLIVAGATLGVFADDARAQVAGAPYALGYGFFGNGLYGSLYNDRPPYYALFPPVYYSYPVPRPYGYSPFAYPPGFMTPEFEQIQPKEVMNPYVPRKPVGQPKERTASVPQVYHNPFIERRSPPALAARPAD